LRDEETPTLRRGTGDLQRCREDRTDGTGGSRSCRDDRDCRSRGRSKGREEERTAATRRGGWSSVVGMRGSVLEHVRSSPRRFARTAVVLVALALLGAPSASASKGLLLGLFDDSSTLGSANAFPLLESLQVQVVRMTLTWGGKGGVASRRPTHPTDPG